MMHFLFAFVFLFDLVIFLNVLYSLSKNINFPDGEVILFGDVKFFCGAWDYIITNKSIISLEILAQDIGNYDNQGGDKFSVDEILRFDIWLYQNIGQISNVIVALFNCILAEQGLGLVVSIIPISNF